MTLVSFTPPTRKTHPTNRLPKGHPVYEEVAPSAHERYLMKREVQCPICEMGFTTDYVRRTRLQAKEILPDFRVLYIDMEPLWYYHWLCEHCGFTYPHSHFTELTKQDIEAISQKLTSMQNLDPLSFSTPRTLVEVMASYYTALILISATDDTRSLMGNTWLRLVWLYETAGSPDYAKMAAQRALDCFMEGMMQSRTPRTVEEDQKLFIIIAELMYRLDQNAEAVKYLRSVATAKDGNRGYVNRASRRLQDIRFSDRK